jgi:hypothetical protein
MHAGMRPICSPIFAKTDSGPIPAAVRRGIRPAGIEDRDVDGEIAHGDKRALPDPYAFSPMPWYTKLKLLLREAEAQITGASADLPVKVFAPR